MEKLTVKNIGPISKAEIEFGDLTVFVGPQATGKSLILQLFDLIHNFGHIKKDLDIWGYSWKDIKDFYSLYFGSGMESAFNTNSEIIYNSNSYDIKMELAKSKDSYLKHFYIPAQRVMIMEQGWVRPFTGFEHSYPYMIKQFSELIRLELDTWSKGKLLFPHQSKLKKDLKDIIQKHIRYGKIVPKSYSNRKQIFMALENNAEISFGSWSAGQKEFAPLLFGLYWALPSGNNAQRKYIKWITIEEPEMGLHPGAILGVMLLIFELLGRGYKITISTHSNTILELIWGINEIKNNRSKENDKEKNFLNLFNIETKKRDMISFANKILSKKFKTYFFNITDSGVETKDITSLNLEDESYWGGITEFSGKVADIVGQIYAHK